MAETLPGFVNCSAPFTDAGVMEIVSRAKRAHLGLMENNQGRIISIRAWDFHAGLRDRGIMADYDFNSVPVPRTLSLDVPRVAFITANTDEYGEMLRMGTPRPLPPAVMTVPARSESGICARASASTSPIPAPITRSVPTARAGMRARCW